MKTQFNPHSLVALLNSKEETRKGAAFTVLSEVTGKDYTFTLRRSLYKETWYTQTYVETEYLQFNYLGYYKNGFIMRKGVQVTSTAAVALGFVLGKIERNEALRNVKFFHLGKCIRCGRTLTDAVSIELGMGPKCRQ